MHKVPLLRLLEASIRLMECYTGDDAGACRMTRHLADEPAYHATCCSLLSLEPVVARLNALEQSRDSNRSLVAVAISVNVLETTEL